MIRRLVFAVSIFSALFGSSFGAFAQQSAGVVCNPRSALTNVRSGPTAKGTLIVASVPNNTSLTVRERVKNPEGTHDWARVEVRHEGIVKSGFVSNELIADSCSLPSASSVVNTSTPSPASSSSPVDDPIGFKGCKWVQKPLAALTSSRRILNSPISASDIISTSCEKKDVTPFLGPAKTYYEMTFNLKTNRPTFFQGRPHTCHDSIVFRGEERGEGIGYLKGEVIVFSQSKAKRYSIVTTPILFNKNERDQAKISRCLFIC